MAYVDHKELLSSARSKFVEGDYKSAEGLLQQILMIDNKLPEIFQMLATIYYDRGQFSKAIKHFQRALEIDPTYSDASVGLSIILNDLGRYDEGKKVFLDAQKAMEDTKKKQTDPVFEDRISKQHLQLGDLYIQYKRYDEALEQYHKAFSLSEKPEIKMKIIDCISKKGDGERAIRELKMFIRDHQENMKAQLWLGVLFYNSNRVADAVDQWEKVLFKEPNNKEARQYIRQAQQTRMTDLY